VAAGRCFTGKCFDLLFGELDILLASAFGPEVALAAIGIGWASLCEVRHANMGGKLFGVMLDTGVHSETHVFLQTKSTALQHFTGKMSP
jgi:hypothetical protein